MCKREREVHARMPDTSDEGASYEPGAGPTLVPGSLLPQ